MNLCVSLHKLFQMVMIDMRIHSEEFLEYNLHDVHEILWIHSISMGKGEKKEYGICVNSLLLNSSEIQMNTLLI